MMTDECYRRLKQMPNFTVTNRAVQDTARTGAGFVILLKSQ